MTYACASDLAGLPGMPGSKAGVLRRARVEQWPFVEQVARGGVQRLFETGHLPPPTRAALALGHGGRGGKGRVPFKRGGQAAGAGTQGGSTAQDGQVAARKLLLKDDLAERAAEAKRMAALTASAGLPQARQAAMDAKLFILKAWELHANAQGRSKAALAGFVAAYNSGHMAAEAWVRQAVSTTSAASIERWAKCVRSHGITALAGNYGNRAGATKVDLQPELGAFAQAMLVQYPHARATHLMQAMLARFASAGLELPSMRSLQRWIVQWRAAHQELCTVLDSPDAWKNKYKTAFGSESDGVERLNQRWELDSTPADVMLTDGRHTVLGVVDVYSRRAKLLVSKTSKATAVATLLRQALLDWGVPEVAKTDNGSDYTSKHIVRVFQSLDVKHELCAPFQPWQKGHIERFFGTFSRGLLELLSGFIGHDVAERSAIEARHAFSDRLFKKDGLVEVRLSAADFQDFCDRWVADVYHHQPHGPLKGQTPYQVAAGWRGTLRTISDERALDVLLAEAPSNNGMRTVQKKGLALDGAWFIAAELEAYIGQNVQVRYDPVDLGRVYVFGGPDLQFVCIAEDPHRTGMDRREVALRAAQMQKERMQATKREAKRQSKAAINRDEVVSDILRHNALAAGKLAMLPGPTMAHESAGLAAAAAAAQAAVRTPGTSADVLALEGVAAAYERIKARAQADEAGITQGTPNELDRHRLAKKDGMREEPFFDDTQQRVQWLLRQAHVRELSGEERQYLADYRKEHPASFMRLQEMAAELFGDQKKEDPVRTGTAPGSV